MASLHCSAPASHSLFPLRRPSAAVHTGGGAAFSSPGRPNWEAAHLNLRFKKDVGMQVTKRWGPLFASNANPPGGSDDKKTSENAQGPPLLTILAGLVVFVGVCWIVGSIVLWIIGLIVQPPPLK